MTTSLALLIFAIKVLVDANFGHKALKEVRELKEVLIGRVDDHEHRIASLEKK
jgi:hypothetical protein